MDVLSKFASVRVSKADDTDNAAWEALISMSDKMEANIRLAFLSSVAQLRAGADSREVALFIEQENPEAAANQILQGIYGGFDGLHDAMSNAMRTALLGVNDKDYFALAVDIDPESPQAASMIEDYVLGSVRQISDEQRQMIETEIKAGLKEGLNPKAIARKVRPMIGLTHAQNATVDNFRALLESNDPASLDRQLRDRRFDESIQSALESGDGLTSEQTDKMVQRYADRMLAFRADTLSRTESMNALHQAQAYSWQQVVDSGKAIASDLYRYWHVAHDERTCPICMPIPEMNPEGVPMNGQFQTPKGLVDGPTMHPNCRCVVFVRPHISSLYNTDPSRLVDELKSRGEYQQSDKRYVALQKFNAAEARDKDGKWSRQSYYHATDKLEEPRQVFDGDGMGMNSVMGMGSPVQRHGIFFASDPLGAGVYGKQIGEYQLKLKNTANLEGSYQKDGLFSQFSREWDAAHPKAEWGSPENTVSRYAYTMAQGDSGVPLWTMFDDKLGAEFVSWLKTKGYDSAAFDEVTEDNNGVEHDIHTTVVFDPKQIKYIGNASGELKDWQRRSLDKLSKFNPNHDARGEFASASGQPEMMDVEHYSPVAGLTLLDPEHAGTGRAGRERQRKDRIGAVHVYDSQRAKLEHQFRHDYRYRGSVPRSAIYDIGKDPDGLVPQNGLYDPTKLEHAIKSHGYAGFRNSESQNPSIIKLFYSLPVEPVAPRRYKGERFGSPHTTPRILVAAKSWISKRNVYWRDSLHSLS